jgi:uncharacterized protein (DUF1800 family)
LVPRGQNAAALALHRFGMGPSGDSIAAIASDPRGALLADLDAPRAGELVVDLPSSGQAARLVFEFQATRRAQHMLALRLAEAAKTDHTAANEAHSGDRDSLPSTGQREPALPYKLMLKEAKARFDAATTARIGFVERLIWFWSNHFCVSADKIVAMAGAYEREAIRPHVLGRFVEMLQAVESHPAMLFYLDNVASMGPDSIIGIDRHKGLNENLGRECLELHTLGVRSGYTQADVTTFAKVLTGWTWFPPSEPVHGGEFVFNRLWHEPGDQVLLGKRYPDTEIDQGRAVLADLARHPATAHHIAYQLAAHFVADAPPLSLVAKLEKTFNETDGSLKELAVTLVSAEESWTPRRTKLKPPAQWTSAVLRLTGSETKIPTGLLLGAQAQLGQPLWRPPGPNGFPDTEAAWIDGIPRRLAFASLFAHRLARRNLNREGLLEQALGPLASPQTRSAVARAKSPAEALTLLIMAPEFLRS